MPRDVRDSQGTAWNCVQAYAGLSDEPANNGAARVPGSPDLLYIVCTPTGGAQSVRPQLPEDWEGLPDEELLEAIAAAED